MSRSKWAWTEGCAPVGVVACGVGDRAGRGLLGAVSSTKRLVKLMAASMFVIALAPAPALAGSADGSHVKTPTPNKQYSTYVHRASAVVLALGSGYSSRGGAARVRVLQRRLAGAGFAPGPIDGRYGPRTEQAVSGFQAARGLRVDGIAGPQTLAQLPHQPTTPHPLTRPTRPAHAGGSRPHTHRQPTPAPGRTVPASRSTNSPQLSLLVLFAALAGALGLSATLLGRRRREQRYAIVDRAATNGAPPSEAISIHPNATTTLEPITTLNPKGSGAGNGTTVPTPDHGQPDDADHAFNLGRLLEDQGDQVGALRAYERADQLGHGAAACSLGVLLEQNGDRAAAEASYGRADQRGDANGAFNLGVLLEDQDDQMGALRAYARADRLGHGAAACNLGVLLAQKGDLAGATVAWRRAEQRGDANGAFNLGILLEEQGNLRGALSAYERADQLGHGAITDMARAATVDLTRQIGWPTAVGQGGGHDGP